MDNGELAERYFRAWNEKSFDAISEVLGSEGTYSDPKTSGPIRGEALKGYVEGLWAAFPDLSFEIRSHAATGPDSAAAEWIMRGTNTGSMGGLPPTGARVELDGADFLTFGNGHIRSVVGYFDSAVIPSQLGLDVVVQPKRIGPFTFGTSTVVQTGKTDIPGAFSITHLEARGPEQVAKVRNGSRASLIDMLKMDAFIGATTAVNGNRMVTITAWTDAPSARRVMKEGAHAEVMKEFYSGDLAKAGRTSVWVLERDNGVMIGCDSCGRMTRDPKPDALCSCGAKLPEPPPFW